MTDAPRIQYVKTSDGVNIAYATAGSGTPLVRTHVTKAGECAVAFQSAFADHEGEPLSVRVGLNAGEPIEEDGDLFGATVILASVYYNEYAEGLLGRRFDKASHLTSKQTAPQPSFSCLSTTSPGR